MDTSHPHVVVCSTYGGGELPTSARAFATAVAEGAADLSSVRYAAFGLGNRTYGQTFARRRRAGRDPRGSGRVPVRGRGSA
ncbi:flavodoxin domain-containing protein [Kocuria marina]|uniref:flavodoxin domain-containing protein n=1 Tax=Kocuria marina TaxID=223184 RepID=UPI0038CD1C37